MEKVNEGTKKNSTGYAEGRARNLSIDKKRRDFLKTSVGPSGKHDAQPMQSEGALIKGQK